MIRVEYDDTVFFNYLWNYCHYFYYIDIKACKTIIQTSESNKGCSHQFWVHFQSSLLSSIKKDTLTQQFQINQYCFCITSLSDIWKKSASDRIF